MDSILRANHFFILALLPLIVYHVNGVPISPTSECTVSIPSKPTVEDLGCVRDAFDQIYSSLNAQSILLQNRPVGLP